MRAAGDEPEDEVVGTFGHCGGLTRCWANWETVTLPSASSHIVGSACGCTMATGFDLGSGADGEGIASVTLAGSGGEDGTRR